MKIFFLILIIVFTSSAGLYLSKPYVVRKNFYKDFTFFNKRFKTEVAFSQNTLRDIIKGKNTKDNVFFSYLNFFVFENKKNENDLSFLSNDEKTFFNNYLSTIGKGDGLSQIKFLESVTPTIEEYYKNSIENCKKYRPLYVKLGFLFGLIIFVLLI